MGLPPTPAELGLDDEGFDELVDSLPPWERKSVLEDLDPPEPWRCSTWKAGKWFLWSVLLFVNSLIVLVSLPILFFVSVLFMNPIIGVFLFFVLVSPSMLAMSRLK